MNIKSIILFCKQECSGFIKLAVPVYFATLTSELNNSFIPSILAGHFGDVKTNYAVITLCTNLILFTGTLPHLCLSSALNTLASQAYGAGENKYLGTLYQRSLFIHLLMCLPIAIVWLNTSNIFTLLGQTNELSTLSAEYMTVYICILPAYAIMYPTMKILQIQEIVLPSTTIFAIGSCIEVITCYLSISQAYKGVIGISYGVVIAMYFMAIAHLVYLRTMSVWCRIWDGFKWAVFQKWMQYLYYGMPLLLTTWIGFFVYYYGTFLMGAISKNAAFVISTYSIGLNIDLFLFIYPFALQSATSIRIGILVGEGDTDRIKKVVFLTTLIVFISQLFQSSILLAGKSVWGHIFTSEETVVYAVVTILYALALYTPIDGIVVNFMGVLLGIGMQKFVIFFPIILLFLTIPIGTLLTVYTRLGPLGYWMGISFGMILRAIILLPIAFYWIDWNNISRVDNIEQVSIGPLQPQIITGESKRNILSTFKTILSRLRFKLLFFLIFLIYIIATILCKNTEYTIDIHIGDSYLKSVINICCVRIVQ